MWDFLRSLNDFRGNSKPDCPHYPWDSQPEFSQHVSRRVFPKELHAGRSEPEQDVQEPALHFVSYLLLPVRNYRVLFTSALAWIPKGEKQQKPKMRLQICIHDTQPFLQGRQIVTPPFKILWKLDLSLIMQEAKL